MARLAGRPGGASTLNMTPDLMPWPLMSAESLMMPVPPEGEEQDDSGEGRADRTWQFSKTKMCKFEIMGMCAKGPQCPFAHSKEELKPLPDLTCTKLCKTLIQTGSCSTKGCKYAHTKDELRATSTFHKTKLCRFSMNGHCALGSKCNFAHSVEEMRQLETDMAILDQVESRQLQNQFQNGFSRQPAVAAFAPGYLGNGSTSLQKDRAGLDTQNAFLANSKKKKGKGDKGEKGAKGGKGGGGKGGKGVKVATTSPPKPKVPIEDYAAMMAAVHPGNSMPGNGFGEQFGGMHDMAMTHGMVSGNGMPFGNTDWATLTGMSQMMGIVGGTQPGMTEIMDRELRGNGLQSNERRQGRRPSNSQQTSLQSSQANNTQGDGSLHSNMRIPPPSNPLAGTTTPSPSPAVAPEPANVRSPGPAYVTQTASDFVVKNTFLEFDGTFGRPLRPVRSAAGRLDQLAEQSELAGLGEMPRVRSHPHDLHSLQEHYELASELPPFRQIIDDADAAGGGAEMPFGWNQPDTTCVVDQKDDMWQVKNTFLTFSPQMKPIRSIRTAEGALCSLGDE